MLPRRFLLLCSPLLFGLGVILPGSCARADTSLDETDAILSDVSDEEVIEDIPLLPQSGNEAGASEDPGEPEDNAANLDSVMAAADEAKKTEAAAAKEAEAQQLAAQQREQEEAKKKEEEVTLKEEVIQSLVLADESAKQVLALLAQFIGKSVLQQQNLPNIRVNFDSQGPITKGKAIRALESLLSLNGVSVVDMGNEFIKAVMSPGVNTQSPLFLDVNPLDLPASQRVYTRLFELEYLNVAQISSMLGSFVTPGLSTYAVFEKSNAIYMTDTLANLQRFQRVLNKVDRMPSFTEEIRMYQLRNIRAKDAESFLNNMQQKGFKKYLEGIATFEAEERTNQLLVVAHPDHFDIIDELIERFDVDVPAFTRSNVIPVKHADATELAAVIDNIISGQQKTKKKEQESAPGSGEGSKGGESGAAAASGGSAEGGAVRLSDFAGIVADKRSNSLVTYGNKNDLSYFRELVDQLDVVLPQVKIEVIVAEVKLTDNNYRGIDMLGIDKLNFLFDDFSPTAFGVSSSGGHGGLVLQTQKGLEGGAESVGGSKYTASNDGNRKIDLVLNALKPHSDAKVLAAPTLIVSHNQDARFFSGEKRPIITGSSTKDSGDSINNSVKYENLGLELKIKPRIGTDGVVEMDILQKIEDVRSGDGVTISNSKQPITDTREAKSYVSVRSGDIIVLGGLQKRNIEKNVRKLPVLGFLPVVGALFSGSTTTEVVQELMVFVQPTVLINPDASARDGQRAIQGHSLEEDIDFYKKNHRFSPKLEANIESKLQDQSRSKRWRRMNAKRAAAQPGSPAV